jgi:hypothetical protein
LFLASFSSSCRPVYHSLPGLRKSNLTTGLANALSTRVRIIISPPAVPIDVSLAELDLGVVPIPRARPRTNPCIKSWSQSPPFRFPWLDRPVQSVCGTSDQVPLPLKQVPDACSRGGACSSPPSRLARALSSDVLPDTLPRVPNRMLGLTPPILGRPGPPRAATIDLASVCAAT